MVDGLVCLLLTVPCILGLSAHLPDGAAHDAKVRYAHAQLPQVAQDDRANPDSTEWLLMGGVGDQDPDPHVFMPPGSGSIGLMYMYVSRSGSFLPTRIFFSIAICALPALSSLLHAVRCQTELE
jgi:hypothetical protein